jgi:hypothetical protein
LDVCRPSEISRVAAEWQAGIEPLPGAMLNQSSKTDRLRKHIVSVSLIDAAAFRPSVEHADAVS